MHLFFENPNTISSSNYLSEGRAEDKEAGDGGQAFDLLNYLVSGWRHRSCPHHFASKVSPY